MKMSMNKTVLISFSLLLALSSCGKSKSLKTAPAESPAPTGAPQPAEQPAPAEPTPAPRPQPVTTRGGNVPGQINEPIDYEQDEVTSPATPQSPRSGAPQWGRPAEGRPGDLPTYPGSPFDNNEDQTGVINPPLESVKQTEERAYQVDFRDQVAVKTGGKTKDLFYTSAGRDGLMEEFKSYNLKVSKEQQVMNANLAKAIVGSKLTRQNSSGDILVTVNVDEFGTLKTYRLKATTEGDMMKLSVAKSGTTGEMTFQGGFLKCLDLDGGCENAYAKIKFAGGYTRLIFRNSLADMHFQYQQNVNANSGFNTWMNYITNSINEAPVAQVFDSLQLSSYEIVNGRAGMGALLTTKDREMVGLSIPLVVSANKSEVNVPVSKLSDLASNYDLKTGASYSQNLSQKINTANLIFNNGLGQIKLNLNMGSPQAPATVWIVASRVQKKVMSLNQIRTFESKVKSF